MRRFLIFLILFFFPVEAMAGNLVNAVFADTDIRQALQDISNQTGIVIVADNTVEGFVSADLKDTPLEKALEIILAQGGYVYTRKDGYYLVGSPKKENVTFNNLSKTIFYRPKYLSVDAIKERIGDTFSQFIKMDSSLNLFSITAPASMIDGILNKIRDLDRPHRFVYVDVLYAKTSYSEMERLLSTEAQIQWKLDGGSETATTGVYFDDLKFGYLYSNNAGIDIITEILRSKGNVVQSARSKLLILEKEKSTVFLEESRYKRFTVDNYTTTVSLSANIELGILAEVIDDKIRLDLDLIASYIEGDLKRSLGTTRTTVSLSPDSIAIIGGVTDYREISKKMGAFSPYATSSSTSKDSFTVLLYAREVPEELARGVLPVLETSIYGLTRLPDKREEYKGLVISGGPVTVIDLSTSKPISTTVRTGIDVNGSIPVSDKSKVLLDGIYLGNGLKSLNLSLELKLIADVSTGLSCRLARGEGLSLNVLSTSIEEETYPSPYLSVKGKVFGVLVNDGIDNRTYSDIGLNLSAGYKISDYATLRLEYFRTLNPALLSSARVELEFRLNSSLFFTVGYDYRESGYPDNIVEPSYGKNLYLRFDYRL
jgi:type IV pilus assembly protein PilQ